MAKRGYDKMGSRMIGVSIALICMIMPISGELDSAISTAERKCLYFKAAPGQIELRHFSQ